MIFLFSSFISFFILVIGGGFLIYKTIKFIFKPLTETETETIYVDDNKDNNVVVDIQKVSEPEKQKDFRPQNFDEYIGQEHIKGAIGDFIDSAKVRNEKLGHFIISGPPGTGKTLMAQIIAKELGVKFVEVIASNIEEPEELLEKVKEADGGILFVDECLPKDTFIISKDGGVYPIQNYQKGKTFLGNNIQNFIKRKTNELVTIQTNMGEITTTLTHPHLAIKGKNKHYKEKNVEQMKAKKLNKGDYLILPKNIPHKTKRNWKTTQLALIALILADGTVMKRKYKNSNYMSGFQFSFKNKEHYLKAKKIIEKSVNSFKNKPTSISYKINRDFVIRIYGTDFCKYIINTFGISPHKKQLHNNINNEIFYSSKKSIRQFLNTIWYFEGWENEDGKYLQMTSEKFIKKLILLHKKFGEILTFTKINTPSMKKKNLKIAYRLHISKLKRKDKIYKNNKIVMAKIKNISIADTKETEVYDYTTDNHIFVADGFITHNCHGLGRDFAEKIYRLMEEWQINGQKVKKFTLGGCTTELGEIIETRKPFYERFKLPIELEKYNAKDLSKIAKQYKEKQYPNDTLANAEEVYKIVGKNSRGTPRKAIKYMDALIRLNGNLDKVFNFYRIIKNGFTEKDMKILDYLAETEKPVGLKGLVAYMGTSKSNYEYLMEPYLIQTKTIQRTARGRVITETGKKVLRELTETLNERKN